MNKILLICFFIGWAALSKAQNDDSIRNKKSEEGPDNKIYTTVDQQPQFPGGSFEFKRYLTNNQIYRGKPQPAGRQGVVDFSFVVERDGSLSDIKVLNLLSKEANAEAFRLVKNSPKWIAGVLDGKTVRANSGAEILFPPDSFPVLKNRSISFIKRVEMNEVAVDTKDSADFFRVVLPPDTSVDKTLEIVKEFYKSGKQKLLGTAYIENNELYRSGTYMEFFDNGKRKAVNNYSGGKHTGDFLEYYPNGKLYISGKCDPIGTMRIDEVRGSTGKIIVSNGTGHLMRYTDDFKKITEEGSIVNGLEEGEWRGIKNDSLSFIDSYEKGVFKGGTTFGKSGREQLDKIVAEPEFPGGMESFYRFLAKNIHYPAKAKVEEIQGKVLVSFIVEKDGSVADVRIERGLEHNTEEECIRVIKLSPRWNPASHDGISMRAKKTVPVTFSLTSDEEDDNTGAKDGADKVWAKVDKEPQFQGGMQAFYTYLPKNIKYPEEAKRNGISGKVFLSFIVEKDGSLTNIKVIKEASPDLDAEAIRVIKISPKWQPGSANGVPCRVRFYLPIAFETH